MEFVQLLRQESPAPCATVNPVNNLLDRNNYLLFSLDRQQFPADFGMSPSSSSNGDEKMPVFRFKKIEMAGLDAYPALNAFILRIPYRGRESGGGGLSQ
jgi:hypothetical protein